MLRKKFLRTRTFTKNLFQIFDLFFISFTAQKMKSFIKDFFSKWDRIRRKFWIWSHLLKKPLMKNFIFCAAILPLFEKELLIIIITLIIILTKAFEAEVICKI